MMAEKAPLSSVPLFSVPQIDLSKVNPTGVGTDPNITADYKTLLENTKRYANELEQRYAQPNWFKIAAGFAKPQLGGFLASVGSASQALGEQTELARAIAPTIAQMRAETAKGNIALGQAMKAAGITEQAGKEKRLPDPVEAAAIASLIQGPGAAAGAGQNIASAQTNELISLLGEGRSYTEITARLPKQFVDQNIESVLKMTRNLKPPSGMPSTLVSTPEASTSSTPSTIETKPAKIPGVPSNLTAELPIGPQLEATRSQIAAMQIERDAVNKSLSKQAETAVPIFEAATNLYKSASNPDLSKAFGVFEKGDVMGAFGKALESGSFPQVLEKMRAQIIAARLGSDREKRAISDLQAMEGALAELKVQMNNGVINPTDFRTVAEGESIPSIRSTQDAFLRGAARIGSVALTKYETKSAFDKALDDPNFDIMKWGSSPYFSSIQDNAKKRTQALILNPASENLPKFMQNGLQGAYQYKPEKSQSKPQAGGTKERPNERIIGGQTWVRLPDGSYDSKVKQ